MLVDEGIDFNFRRCGDHDLEMLTLGSVFSCRHGDDSGGAGTAESGATAKKCSF